MFIEKNLRIKEVIKYLIKQILIKKGRILYY